MKYVVLQPIKKRPRKRILKTPGTYPPAAQHNLFHRNMLYPTAYQEEALVHNEKENVFR
jgi:hypothetical protein